jgi:hydroxymethylpyrimidine pyrophosphatase-like HAD family hydrolase
VLTTGRPYAGVHSYLKELHMNKPGDYCITYNGALVQKAADGSTVAQTALSYDDYLFLEKLSREVGSHFHALDRNTFIPLTAISATTPCMSPLSRPFRWCSAKPKKWTRIRSS